MENVRHMMWVALTVDFVTVIQIFRVGVTVVWSVSWQKMLVQKSVEGK